MRPLERFATVPRTAAVPIALGVAGLLLAGTPSWSQEEVGTLAEAEGDVLETRLWDDSERAVEASDSVRLRTALETGRRSRARLLFDQGAVIDMLQRDRIEIREEEPPERTGVVTDILQGIGTSRIYIAGAARDDFRVSTRDANLGPKGTVLVVRVTPSRTLTWVLEGLVELTAVVGGPPVQVRAGEMTVVRRGRRPTPPTPFDSKSGATASTAVPPTFDRPSEEHPDPPLFPTPEELGQRVPADVPGGDREPPLP